jgi:hypothetical protein
MIWLASALRPGMHFISDTRSWFVIEVHLKSDDITVTFLLTSFDVFNSRVKNTLILQKFLDDEIVFPSNFTRIG